MSLRSGLVLAGRIRASPRKAAGKPPMVLSLESPRGWPGLEDDRISMSRDRAMKISTVNRCVEVLSNSMAVLPVYIMDEGTKERLTSHRLGRVLWGRANEAMSSFDYSRLMLCNQLLRGNAYGWIFRDQTTGHPRELIPLPPDHVEPWVDRDGRLWYRFLHPRTGAVYDLRPEDVLHYKAYSEDGIRGISVLRRAALTLDTAQAAQEYENSTWRSGGQPSGILTTDADLGDEIAVPQEDGTVKTVDPKEQLRQSWERVHRGPNNAMRLAVLDLGLKYTVPQDIVTRIINLRESKESLLDEVRVIPVTTKSGKRTIKKRGQHQGFATVAEAAKFGKAATPQFAVLEYNIEKRGGYLPVTNELLEDSDNNIAAIAEEWLADEARVTANKEILAVIQAKQTQDLKDLDGVLKAWVGLGSTFRATSKLITNDDGLLWLGTLKDANGRYLLTPNPADPKQLRLCVGPHTLPVKTYDNETIPTEEGKIPMILGDLKEGVVYWDRRVFSVKVFDQATIGDFNAAEQDMTIWRGSLRDDCTQRDDGAFVNSYIAGGSGAAG